MQKGDCASRLCAGTSGANQKVPTGKLGRMLRSIMISSMKQPWSLCRKHPSPVFRSGIPFSIKDLIDTKGIVTAFGAKSFQNRVPVKDAEVVKSIKSNGGLILGKTNTHQFALGLITPPTKNPWDLTRIPGGSSGGSAAAIAADLALVAVGTDTGESIRIPASAMWSNGTKAHIRKNIDEGSFPYLAKHGSCGTTVQICI